MKSQLSHCPSLFTLHLVSLFCSPQESISSGGFSLLSLLLSCWACGFFYWIWSSDLSLIQLVLAGGVTTRMGWPGASVEQTWAGYTMAHSCLVASQHSQDAREKWVSGKSLVDGTGLSPWLLVKPMSAVCCWEHQCFFAFPRNLKEMLFCLFLALGRFGGNGAWSTGRWHKTACCLSAGSTRNHDFLWVWDL